VKAVRQWRVEACGVGSVVGGVTAYDERERRCHRSKQSYRDPIALNHRTVEESPSGVVRASRAVQNVTVGRWHASGACYAR